MQTENLFAADAVAPRQPALPLLFLVLLTGAMLLVWQKSSVNQALYHRVSVSLKTPMMSLDTQPEDRAAAEAARLTEIEASEAALGFHTLLHRWDPLIAEASKRFDVPENWIRAVMNTETGGRTVLNGTRITSAVGAQGLMQVMPGTYEEMRQQYDLGANVFDPRDNIFAGAAYLHWLHAKFGFSGMFAAYNAGPGTFENHLVGKDLPGETVAYVARVARFLGTRKADAMLASAGAKKGDLKFTGPDGAALLIDAANVRAVRAPLPGEFAQGVNAVLRVGKRSQGVREDVVLAAALIRKHGGDV